MESEKPKESNTVKPKAKPSTESDLFKAFHEAFEAEKEIELKIALAIEFMRKVLSQPNGVSLKDFWDAKKLCGPLFKEQMNPIKRNHLWTEYTELADEARRLKEIIDEQAAFSIEQIELAIEGLEKEMETYDALLAQVPPLDFPRGFNLKQEQDYSPVQRELQLLKTLISRLDALRKEILATDMRISHKNRILKRLSKLGDVVFPKRKELIKKLSDAFTLDVEAFVKERFSSEGESSSAPYYVIRTEIKNFQGLAKLLTLNTQAFSKTRKLLSECWDKIREQEKEYKKEMGERSEEQKKNFEEISEKVTAFLAFCEKEENLQRHKIQDEANRIQDEMRQVSLHRDQVVKLRAQIQKARGEALDKIKGEATRIQEAEMKKIQDLKDQLSQAIKEEAKSSLEALCEKEKTLKDAFNSLSLSLTDTLLFERSLSDLKSFILDKKKDQATSSEDLEALFDEREALFEEVKGQMEVYRKEMGASNLDFEKAMTYRELYDSAKIHLDREMEALQQLEDILNAD